MNLQTILILAVVFGLTIIILLIILIMKTRGVDSLRHELTDSAAHGRLEMQQRLDSIQKDMQENSRTSFQAIQSQFKQSAEIIRDVTDRLRKIDDTNTQVLDFSKQLQSLENILRNPKQRGVLGEYFLESLLGNILPPSQYAMQYQFSSGEIVDAAVFYRDSIIPVDAKFSLEKYNRMMEEQDAAVRQQLDKELRNDIKVRINETSKYIKPKENTTDFAFMFIPAEGIYYSLLNYSVGTDKNQARDMIEYAFSKHVIIVSPTSFFAYLETVLQGLKAQTVQDNIREIIKRINTLGRHLGRFGDTMSKLGTNLGTTVNAYNRAAKEYRLIDTDIVKITDGESGGAAQLLDVDRPQGEED